MTLALVKEGARPQVTTADRDTLIVDVAHALSALARGDSRQAAQILRGVVAALEPAQGTLPGVTPPATTHGSDDARRSAAIRVFAYWQQRCDHKQAKMTPERVTHILARLRDGYSEAEIKKAIDGAAEAAFVNKDSGQRYDDLELICRNGSKLESFMARGVRSTGEIVVATTDASPVDDQIAEVRREMSVLAKAGRTTEYEEASRRLAYLINQRKKGK